jgi:glycosyltransferase involved in cell wall biosynthesis
MLKIAVVTAYFPSSSTPTEGRSAYETLRVLSDKCDVRVFFPHASYPSWLKSRRGSNHDFDSAYKPIKVVTEYHKYSALPLLSRPFNGWMAGRVLLPHVRRFHPDLIFSYVMYPDGMAALKIGKALSLPVAVMGIGSDIHNIADRFSKMHTQTLLHNADFLFTVSEDLRKRIVAMGAPDKNTRTIVNGCDLSIFHVLDRLEARRKLRIEPTSKAVVYIGRMDLRKGLRELVEAATSLHAEHPNLHVYMVGDGPDKPIVENAIQAKNASGYVHLQSGCHFDDVAVWMTAADAVTLPSYMEGCPNVVVEALACGRPVVATNVGGIPELMSDECGRLIPPRSASELAHALATVLDSNWNASVISAFGSRSWDNVAAELLEVFESLISARSMAPDAS